MPNLTDEQIEILARQAAEVTKLQARHSNEYLDLQNRHKTERDAAKIQIVDANRIRNHNPPG
jgi:hypothetical protein